MSRFSLCSRGFSREYLSLYRGFKSILTFLRVLLSQRNAKVPRYPHWQTEKKLTKCIVVATAAMLIVIWRKTTKNIVLKQKVYFNFSLKKLPRDLGFLGWRKIGATNSCNYMHVNRRVSRMLRAHQFSKGLAGSTQSNTV